jgi:2-phosphosulfolactate phosphatase
MEIQKLRLPECHQADDLVVVIDVIRAFTTTAFAFASGAEKIILVGTIEEAFELGRKFPDALLMGEDGGRLVKGFHFGNSPVQMQNASVKGKTLIMRSSSGTQGVVKSINAKRMLVSSFVIAEATLNRIKVIAPAKVSFIITGTTRGGIEDLALADYLESRMNGEKSPQQYIDRVLESPVGKVFKSGEYDEFPVHDLEASCQLDYFSFATEVSKEDGLHVLRPVLI